MTIYRSNHSDNQDDEYSENANESDEVIMVQSMLTSYKLDIVDAILQKYENAVIECVVEDGVTRRATADDLFKNFICSLINGHEPPSTRTILRRMTELFRVLEPMLANYLSSLPVAISLTLHGWSNRNLKGFYIATAHWVDIDNHATKSILLTILDVESGNGVGQRVGSALFDYLKRMGRDVVTHLLNVVTDNGSDAVAAVTRLFQLVNTYVGVLKTVKKSTKVLCEALVTIRRSKVVRQQYRIEVIAADLGSKEPTHQDSPTRWNSTHEMCTDAYSKRVVLDNIMD
eukprot:jgi/Hompol1/3068/HPOL_006317-RA